jgi:hypothetical protein
VDDLEKILDERCREVARLKEQSAVMRQKLDDVNHGMLGRLEELRREAEAHERQMQVSGKKHDPSMRPAAAQTGRFLL